MLSLTLSRVSTSCIYVNTRSSIHVIRACTCLASWKTWTTCLNLSWICVKISLVTSSSPEYHRRVRIKTWRTISICRSGTCSTIYWARNSSPYHIKMIACCSICAIWSAWAGSSVSCMITSNALLNITGVGVIISWLAEALSRIRTKNSIHVITGISSSMILIWAASSKASCKTGSTDLTL